MLILSIAVLVLLFGGGGGYYYGRGAGVELSVKDKSRRVATEEEAR